MTATVSTPHSLNAPHLTNRELDVLRCMANGLGVKQAARHLFIAEGTVKAHSRRVFAALHAADRAHAVALGFYFGLLSAKDLELREVGIR